MNEKKIIYIEYNEFNNLEDIEYDLNLIESKISKENIININRLS